jgi:SAM-dependent methyltransferase
VRHTREWHLKVYDEVYTWPQHGDEWDGFARSCHQPYEAWKGSVVENFLAPRISPTSVVLEIGAGHARWSETMVDLCGELILVDLSPRCIEYCKGLFASRPHVRCMTTEGVTLPEVGDGTVDLVWSFETFVQLDEATTSAYLREIRRVLKPEGTALLHHPGRTHAFLWLGFMMEHRFGRMLYKLISMGRLRIWEGWFWDGWRSNLSRRLFRRLAEQEGLVVEAQVQSWGPRRKFHIRRFGDYIAVLRKGPEPSTP